MHIKYFSWLRDQIGIESENFSITNDIKSVDDLLKYLKNKSEKQYS